MVLGHVTSGQLVRSGGHAGAGAGRPGYTAMVIADGVASGEGSKRVNSHSYLSHLRFKT